MTVAPVRTLMIQHERLGPGGLVQDWLEHHTAGVDVLRIDDESSPPPDLDSYEMLVSLGSIASAYDDLPWIRRELDLLVEADRRGVAVLGLCYGSQSLARALGGSVRPSESPEIGWFEVGSRDPGLIAEGPWFQWHFDTFDPPPRAEVLAANPAGTQAFRVGPHLGLQFHPEVDLGIIGDWVVDSREELDRRGIDPDRLLERSEAELPGSSLNTARLLEGFVREIGR